MDYGKDSYTTVAQVQAYLNLTLNSNQTSALNTIIPAVSRWIDRTLGTNFDNLDRNNPASWTAKKFSGGAQEISIRPCQQITLVQAINPYDFSVWYTYTQPLEYTQEPYDYPVKRSLRIRNNEFSDNFKWPGGTESIQVTALFTEYDYVNGSYPSDIVLLANHVCAVWLQNAYNADGVERESVEGHLVQKKVEDIMANDPMVTRVLESRQEVWLDEM